MIPAPVVTDLPSGASADGALSGPAVEPDSSRPQPPARIREPGPRHTSATRAAHHNHRRVSSRWNGRKPRPSSRTERSCRPHILLPRFGRICRSAPHRAAIPTIPFVRRSTMAKVASFGENLSDNVRGLDFDHLSPEGHAAQLNSTLGRTSHDHMYDGRLSA